MLHKTNKISKQHQDNLSFRLTLLASFWWPSLSFPDLHFCFAIFALLLRSRPWFEALGSRFMIFAFVSWSSLSFHESCLRFTIFASVSRLWLSFHDLRFGFAISALVWGSRLTFPALLDDVRSEVLSICIYNRLSTYSNERLHTMTIIAGCVPFRLALPSFNDLCFRFTFFAFV